MGLFDKFKKNKVKETEQVVQTEEIKEEAEVTIEEPADEEVTEEVAQQEEAEAAAEEEGTFEAKEESLETGEGSAAQEEDVKEAVSEEKCRFTMLVEKAFQLIEDQGVVVMGELSGKVKKGEEVYLLFPNGTSKVTRIDEMEVGPGKRVEEAEDDKVAFQFREIMNRNLIPQYTVITNIAPCINTQDAKEMENPRLLGLSMQYPVLGQEPVYNNMLIYQICHAKYVVPAALEAPAATAGEVPQIKFPSLVDPSDGQKHMLPVFTDWDALSRWENLFDENHPAQGVVMTFPEAVAVCKGNGIVVNPYGPMTIVVNSDNIQQIVNKEAYKKEFGASVAMPNNEKVAAGNEEPRMLIGVPKENDEVKAVTSAMIEFAKQEKLIQRIDLLFKVDMQQEMTFVCIVDCPMTQSARIFATMEKAVSPKLKEVKRIDFLVFGASKLASDLATDKSVIYRATE